MRAFVITLEGNAYSEKCADRCIRSAQGVEIERFKAVDSGVALSTIAEYGLKWTWAYGNCTYRTCPTTGLKQHPYGRLEPCAGCAMSHYLLWCKCVELGEPILILEHDAVFIRPLPEVDFIGICQINDPRGATPRGDYWSGRMAVRGDGVFHKTRIFTGSRPDGLAGNSAYLIKPFAAREAMEKFNTLGVWPNDATLCIQLFPYLQELYPFVTRTEQTVSTST